MTINCESTLVTSKGAKLKGELRNWGFDTRRSPGLRSMSKHQLSRLTRCPDTPTFALGCLIGVLVSLPLIGGGRLLLLDWSFGPHNAIVTPFVLGLNGGLTAGIEGSVVTAVLGYIIGASATWLPILLFFPVATVGAGRLTRGSRWSRMAAGTLYAVNPFVFNRLYVGHLPLLIGYALMPYAVAAAIRSLDSTVSRWPFAAVWWAVLTGLSPHFAWIFGLLLVGILFVAALTKTYRWRLLFNWFVTVLGSFLLMSSYLLLPRLVTKLPTQVGQVSLDLYRTSGDPHFGLFANVLALYGFWRIGPGPELPKSIIGGWPLLALAIILVVVYGGWITFRKRSSDGIEVAGQNDSDAPPLMAGVERGGAGVNVSDELRSHLFGQRQLAFLLVFVGVVGFFLSLGDQGPTSRLFMLAYDHLPFFDLMREPQKFLMLLALAYSVLFGWGVESLSRVGVKPTQMGAFIAAAVLGIALPLGYTANIFNGLAGQIKPSAIPSGYERADILMGAGSGNVLSLPWHLYMSYPFTNGRVVANIAPTTFRRNVISGDNVESSGVESQSTSPRSTYIQSLLHHGPNLKNFGALVAPLGVKYVVLSKTVDWPNYEWLGKQKDLHLILDTGTLEVWRNDSYVGEGRLVGKVTQVSKFSELLGLAKENELWGAAGLVHSGKNMMSSSSIKHRGSTASLTSGASMKVRQLSPIAYEIPSGKAGWVAVDAAFQTGWSLNGVPAKESAVGTLLVHTGKSGGNLIFTPWRLVRLGYLISIGAFTFFALLISLENRFRKERRRSHTG